MSDTSSTKKSHVYPLVAAAYEKVQQLSEVEAEKVNRVLKADEDFLKESIATTAKMIIEPEDRQVIKFLGAISKAVGLGWVETNGDFWKLSVLTYKAFDTFKTTINPLKPIPLKVVEFCLFLNDVAEYGFGKYLEGVRKENAEKFKKEVDAIVLAYGQVEQRLRRELPDANREAEQLIPKIIGKYTDGRGASLFKTFRSLPPDARKNHPVTYILTTWLTNDLEQIGDMRHRLYSVANTVEAFIGQCERARSNPSNAGCGFPDYRHFRHPQRGAMIREMSLGHGGAIKTAETRSRGLETAAINLWSFVGYAIGFSAEQAMDMARI